MQHEYYENLAHGVAVSSMLNKPCYQQLEMKGFTPPFTDEAVGKQMITDLDYN
jgi:hypothetical protein